jgi:hypothetical protein
METSVSINQSKLSWTMRSTQLNSHESLWRVPYRPIPGGRTMDKRAENSFFCTSASEKRGGEPVYAHGDIDVNLEDPDNDRHGKRASGRIVVVHWSSSAHHLDMRKAQPTNNQQEGAGGNSAQRPYRRYALRLY